MTGACACCAVRYETGAEPFHRTLCDGHAHEPDVPTCSLDEPELAAPHDHAWASQRLGWMRVDAMPAFPRSRGEGLNGQGSSARP